MTAMEMPEINQCNVNECFYNMDNECHANAILVGSSCPRCDTFIAEGDHAEPADTGRVGACHEADCVFNEELSCQAPGINVGHHAEHADCLTYTPVQ